MNASPHTGAARKRPLPILLVIFFAVMSLLAMTPAALATTSTSTAQSLTLSDDVRAIKAWPYVRVLHDNSHTLTAAQAALSLDRFEKPKTNFSTLGVNIATVWLHVPIVVNTTRDEQWIAEIDYPPLNTVDFVLMQNGRIVERAELGSLRPFASRPLLSRSHAAPLKMKPGERYDLLVRINTRGATILPLMIERPDVFHSTSLAEQMLQGLLLGIALCLVFYSIGQWYNSRERLFIKYVLLVCGSMTFTLIQFGIGTQYLWTDNVWIETYVAGLSALLAIAGTFLFLEEALRDSSTNSVVSQNNWFGLPRLMKGGALLAFVLAVAYALDMYDVRVLTIIITVMGPLPSIVAMPRIIRRVRQGDPVGWYLLFAFTVYMFSVIIISAVIRGQMPVNFWTLHSFQFGATFDMLAFMYVLALRSKAVRLAIQHASMERDIMRTLAHSDPLTGLANRRSLSEALTKALSHSNANNMLAVYVIDLDNFKPVNDTYGHDVGDELLVAIALRLQAHVRSGDIVARFGGDEFVVLGSGLRNEQQAEDLGRALLQVFNEPYQLSRHQITANLTIGYAIAPQDGKDNATILKMADDAMYAGKQTGKACLRRA
jgi:diguanylate cyclase